MYSIGVLLSFHINERLQLLPLPPIFSPPSSFPSRPTPSPTAIDYLPAHVPSREKRSLPISDIDRSPFRPILTHLLLTPFHPLRARPEAMRSLSAVVLLVSVALLSVRIILEKEGKRERNADRDEEKKRRIHRRLRLRAMSIT